MSAAGGGYKVPGGARPAPSALASLKPPGRAAGLLHAFPLGSFSLVPNREVRMSLAGRAAFLALLLSNTTLAAAQDPKPIPEPIVRREQPLGPSTVTARIVAAGRVEITWDSVPGAVTYHVARLAPPNGWQRVATVPPTTRMVADTGRNLSTAHTYQVVAMIGNVASRPTVSEPVQGPPPVVAPATPTVSAPRCDAAGPATMHCHVAQSWISAAAVPPVEVSCPSGHYLMSGGYNSAMVMGYNVMASAPVSGRQAWRVILFRIRNFDIPSNHSQNLTVYVVCRREQ